MRQPLFRVLADPEARVLHAERVEDAGLQKPVERHPAHDFDDAPEDVDAGGRVAPARARLESQGQLTDRERPPLGGAGLFSTARDVARFYQMMLNKGTFNRRRILKPQTVAEMTRKQTGTLLARPGMPWGLGFVVVEDPQAMEANRILSPNSFGHGGAYSTQSWADPSLDLIWVVMFQRSGKGNGITRTSALPFRRRPGKGCTG